MPRSKPLLDYFAIFIATLDCLAKMKVTCSGQNVREKLDVIWEKHDQAIFDLKTEMSKAQELVTEKEPQVVMLEERCASSGHICNGNCTVQKKNATGELANARKELQPGFAIIFDSIDGKLERRHMSKDKQNLDYHWVNHKIVINRVSGTNLDSSPRDLLAVPNITFLPSVKDLQLHRHNYIVLVSRILVDHLKCFGMLRNVCVRHIPNKYSKEMAKKSVSTYVNCLTIIPRARMGHCLRGHEGDWNNCFSEIQLVGNIDCLKFATQAWKQELE